MPDEDSLSQRSTGFEPTAIDDGFDYNNSTNSVRHPDDFDSGGGGGYNVDEEEAYSFTTQDDVPIIGTRAAPPHRTYNPDGTNTLYTVFLIVNAALGAGLLNFPK